MNVALRKAWTWESFLDWASVQDGRYEFDGTGPVPVTGGNLWHSRIMLNLNARLLTACDHGWHLFSDVAVATVGKKLRCPDAVLTRADRPGSERIVADPVLVFEVVSPTSGRTDHDLKRSEYGAVPTVLRYVVIESQSMLVTVHARAGDHWIRHTLGFPDTLGIPEAGLSIPVRDLYKGTDLLA